MLPAAADEVSVGIAHLFSGYAQEYQAQAARAAAFHEHLLQHLTASAHWYAAAEAANTASLLHSDATAAPSAGGIAAAPGALIDMLTSANAALGQLLNQIPNFWSGLADVALLAVIVSLLPALALFTLVGVILSALWHVPFELFGVLIWP
ncbi:hypothetical protein A5696_05370 [Mycobacterium sp. E2699]|nr:hypothetical protein A5696_05370 [Mycobacterium sp. E2699]OBI57615.1 hypothetical protein A5705_18865 [Mycobacterium sp. E787]